ncbi:MAG TPA: nucleoside hydrolase [Clostridia bacterium]|nr:nucleoside hydrolase [Clostridia bacterium]
MAKRKLLLDTDIGSDIDDAACLAWLLRQEDCELLGITTVSGQPERRAAVASALTHAAGREDIPIHAGTPDPIWGRNIQPRCPQADLLQGLAHGEGYETGSAIPFLRDVIRAHPGEITLLAIGPMSNVGLLFAMDPELPSMLAGLALMCGSFGTPLRPPGHREWNAKADPYATARAYQAACPLHRSYGLDVTVQVQMERADFLAKAREDPLLRAVAQLSAEWFTRSPVITFHDPLAAVGILDPDVCGYVRGQVCVSLEEESLGRTDFTPSEQGVHDIATNVHCDRFFDRFFGAFGKA